MGVYREKLAVVLVVIFMNIKKENNELVVRIPLKQKINNPYMDDNDLAETDNLVGIIAGNEYSLSQLIDFNYKEGPDKIFKEIYLSFCPCGNVFKTDLLT